MQLFVCVQSEAENNADEPPADQPPPQQRRVDQQRASDRLILLCDSTIYLCWSTVLLVMCSIPRLIIFQCAPQLSK